MVSDQFTVFHESQEKFMKQGMQDCRYIWDWQGEEIFYKVHWIEIQIWKNI